MTKYKKVVEEEGSKRMQWCCQAPCLFQLKKILPGKLTNPFERKKTDLKIALRRLKAIIMKRNMLTYIIIHMDLHCLPQCTWHHCTVLSLYREGGKKLFWPKGIIESILEKLKTP